MRIGLVTGARSDWSHLQPLARALRDEYGKQDFRILVTGSHGDREFGQTEREIEADGFSPYYVISLPPTGTEPRRTAIAAGTAMRGIGAHLGIWGPDLVFIFGDRFEQLAAAVAMAMCACPIAHVGGGDETRGSQDNQYRHAITKLAALHFTGTTQAAARVRQMGEPADRVHVVGELSLDRLAGFEPLTPAQLTERLGMPRWEPPILVTYHPDTLASGGEWELLALAGALCVAPFPLVITAANADAGGRAINTRWREWADRTPEVYFAESLGWHTYASLMHHAACVVGNSSSALLEAPSFGLPAVNIGPRQDGRLKPANVIDCASTTQAIAAAIRVALSGGFRLSLAGLVNPYASTHPSGAAGRIMAVLRELPSREKLLRKEFIDL